MELNMMINEAKLLAMKALRRKLRKMELESEMDGSSPEEMPGEMDTMEKGMNNQENDAREMGDVESATDGEDGEKEMSIEIEAEGDKGSMEELYKRMAAEFGAEPESRKASGQKKSMLGGFGGKEMGKKKR
jgi:hypothetical protein